MLTIGAHISIAKGWDCLLNVLQHPKLSHLPFFLETPFDDDGHADEIAKIKNNINK